MAFTASGTQFSRAAVAAPHSLASRTGQRILEDGGNAIESMVAMAATIAVIYPNMNSLGGDGFWLIRLPDGTATCIEACGQAALAATIDRLRGAGLTAIPPHGVLAALTVPGAVGGWEAALEISSTLGGKIPLHRMLEDAIGLARNGYAISKSEAEEDPREPSLLTGAPGFLANYYPDGRPPRIGEIRREPRLAEKLERLAKAGLDDFYRGGVARDMALDCIDSGVLLRQEDFAAYRPARRQPLSLRVGSATVYNTPPPTQGLASLVLLGLFDRLPSGTSCGSFEHLHALVEATKIATQVAESVVTDFDRLIQDPRAYLEPAWLDAAARAIDLTRASSYPPFPCDGGTVWMGAIDETGLAVSYIQSNFWEYGSGCVLTRTGVQLQNRGVAFSLDPASLNPLEPGRRPFHTLNPPMAVFDDGRVCSYGSMGGAGQPQFQAQVFTRYAQFGQSPAEALDAPRFLLGQKWGQGSSSLKVEARMPPAIVERLTAAGHDVEWSAVDYDYNFGHAGMVIRHPDGRLEAAHDPRSDGNGDGY